MNTIQACHRHASVVGLVGFSSLAALEVFYYENLKCGQWREFCVESIFVCIYHWYFTMSTIFIINITPSFEYTCLCRCGVSVVACGTVGCLSDNPWGAGGYQIVTMTTLFPVFNKSSTSLRRNCCRFGGVFVAGCRRLRKLRRNGVFFIGFSFLGITSELFDEFAYWFLNYQPSFYYCAAMLLSILFHSFLFPCISFQILILWILFLMWAIYIYRYHCFYHFFNVLLHVCFMYHYFVPLFICIFIFLSIYWKSGTSDLMLLMLFVLQCTDYK